MGTDRYLIRFSCPACQTAGMAAVTGDDWSSAVYDTVMLTPGFYVVPRAPLSRNQEANTQNRESGGFWHSYGPARRGQGRGKADPGLSCAGGPADDAFLCSALPRVNSIPPPDRSSRSADFSSKGCAYSQTIVYTA